MPQDDTLKTETPESCKNYRLSAQEYVLDPDGSDDLAKIHVHIERCEKCRQEIGSLLKADASVRQTFKALEDSLPELATRNVAHILDGTREPSESAVLLKRVRRPVNGVLLIAIVAFSTVGLITLALYLLKHLQISLP